jgi:hypothetical protein
VLNETVADVYGEAVATDQAVSSGLLGAKVPSVTLFVFECRLSPAADR